MKKKAIKVAVFTTLLLSMVYYIGWVFYISEPTYIDRCYKVPERYDLVSIPKYRYSSDKKQEVMTGIVMQVDSSTALIKCKEWGDEFYELDFKKSEYRVIGKGTIYHKVNDYVGFNIMFVTQIFIAILSVILSVTLISILNSFLNRIIP